MKKGFTLIEIIVSVAIFTVVMTVALGALLAMSEASRKAETLKSVINNLTFSLDSMSRAIRTGSNYRCGSLGTVPQNCAGGHILTFKSAEGIPGAGDSPFLDTQVAYCRGEGTTCSSSGGLILRSIDGGSTFAAITAPEVVITNLNFIVIGAPTGDGIQPKVTILISGYVQVSGGGPTGQRSAFNLQTSVTQRIYDI